MAKHAKRRFSFSWLVIGILALGFILLAVVLFWYVSYSQRMIHEMHENSFVYDSRERMERNFVVEPRENRMYIPHAKVWLPYDDYVSDYFRYRAIESNEAGGMIVSFHDATVSSVLSKFDNTCEVPFIATIDTELGAHYKHYKLDREFTLEDGRNVGLYHSNAGHCEAYVSSIEGREKLDFLRQLSSY